MKPTLPRRALEIARARAAIERVTCAADSGEKFLSRHERMSGALI